jgi:hypothetical protein
MNLQLKAILAVSTVSISRLSGPKDCIIGCGGFESTGHIALYKVVQTIAGRPTIVQRLKGHMWHCVTKTLCKSDFKLSGKWRCVVRKTERSCSSNSTVWHPRRHEPWTTSVGRTDILYLLGVFLAWKFIYSLFKWGTRWRRCLRHCATSRKFVGSVPNEVIGIFHSLTTYGHTMALESTQPPTEMSTMDV